MSITFTKAYVANEKPFTTLREAQEEALGVVLLEVNLGEDIARAIVDAILEHKDTVVDILTMTERSRPKARAVNGGRKPRKNRVTEPATTTAA